MRNIAIIGKNSYIGSHVVALLKTKGMSVVEVDAVNDQWQAFDFTEVDTVIHVAAIVHRKDISDADIYEEVNVKLPVKILELAQKSGVKQFVFLSSMAVYGKGHVLKDCCIDPKSQTKPTTEYAKSKLKAEEELMRSVCGDMVLSIVRPPSVYGYGCRGNLFDRYEKIADMIRYIPACELKCLQGVVHIDNLCQTIYTIVRDRKAGCYHPQDKELLSASEMLCEIRMLRGKKCDLSSFLGKLASLFAFVPVYKKLFGSVYYSEKFTETEKLDCNMLTTREGLGRMYRDKT